MLLHPSRACRGSCRHRTPRRPATYTYPVPPGASSTAAAEWPAAWVRTHNISFRHHCISLTTQTTNKPPVSWLTISLFSASAPVPVPPLLSLSLPRPLVNRHTPQWLKSMPSSGPWVSATMRPGSSSPRRPLGSPSTSTVRAGISQSFVCCLLAHCAGASVYHSRPPATLNTNRIPCLLAASVPQMDGSPRLWTSVFCHAGSTLKKKQTFTLMSSPDGSVHIRT